MQDLFQKGVLARPLHLGNPSNVQDRYEIMAYAAQPRSKALGAVLDVSSAAFATSQNLPNIWPQDNFPETHGPYSAHPWHSAQFRFTYAEQQNYWNALMKRFGLPTNQ